MIWKCTLYVENVSKLQNFMNVSYVGKIHSQICLSIHSKITLTPFHMYQLNAM